MATQADITAMRRASILAARGLGFTRPAAVVGRVVGVAPGRPACGDTAYVTLASRAPALAGRLAAMAPAAPAALVGAGITTLTDALRLDMSETAHAGSDLRATAVPRADAPGTSTSTSAGTGAATAAGAPSGPAAATRAAVFAAPRTAPPAELSPDTVQGV
ncbi:hypothetical protein AB0C52_26795 [Streptomyces sp. NPDC048717]|uniref:hypothetical protein n=1 Tax=Streptomyces sp. NPDC048717 TaxID=3154928 RepID=UPI003444E218